MPNVTKKDLIDGVVESTKEKRVAVKTIVQEFLNLIVEELGNGHRIELRDFGVFEVKRRAPRVAQNPKTLAKVEVPAKSSVKFKAGRLMKERVDRVDPTGDGKVDGRVGHAGGRDVPIVETTAARSPSRF